MRYLCAPDSFKESLTAAEAARALAEGIRRGDPDAEIRCLPMADGGEGTARALADATGGTMLTAGAHDPLGRPVQAGLALLGDGRTAVVETAAASGLALLRPSERDPKATTSYGTGELIRAALDAGAETIIVGLGGSATNDAGCGLLQALGVRLLDHDGRDVRPGGAALAEVERVDLSGLDRRLGDVHVIAACDVTNPLTGPEGASAVFGPQKGAKAADIPKIDGWLRGFAALAKTVFPESDADFPGSGAAGGMGFALRTFLGASLEPGVSIVLEETGLAEKIRAADMVVTGEGRLDAQTAMGKAPAGVARLAKRYGKPVVAFAGGIADGAQACHAAGIDAFFPAVRGVTTLETAMDPHNAFENLAASAEQVFRLIAVAGGNVPHRSRGGRVLTRAPLGEGN